MTNSSTQYKATPNALVATFRVINPTILATIVETNTDSTFTSLFIQFIIGFTSFIPALDLSTTFYNLVTLLEMA